MQIISKNIFNLFGGKNHQFITFDSICASKWQFWLKMVILTPKMVKIIFETICIFTAPKNYTINFEDTPFTPGNCISAKFIPDCAPFNQPSIFKLLCFSNSDSQIWYDHNFDSSTPSESVHHSLISYTYWCYYEWCFSSSVHYNKEI